MERAQREFRYNNIPLTDPGPELSVPQVREFYANIYPEITTAEIDGPENKANKIVYTFRRAVGTKGGELNTRCRVLQQQYDSFYVDWHRRMVAATRKEFPLGESVRWRHNAAGHIQTGKVIDYGYGSVIFVRNDKSGIVLRRKSTELESA